MLTAIEANRLSRSIDDTIKNIDELIKEHATARQSGFFYYHHLDPAVKDSLVERGFNVERQDADGYDQVDGTFISW